MKYEKITFSGLKLIGVAKEIPLAKGAEECPKFWNEFVGKYLKSTADGTEPASHQQAIRDNMIGEYAPCFCDMEKGTFLYVIGGIYQGGDVPEGFALYNLPDGEWLKFEFEGGMEAFHQQYTEVYDKFLPAHPELQARMDINVEWYDGMDMNASDYRCGVMLPLKSEIQ